MRSFADGKHTSNPNSFASCSVFLSNIKNKAFLEEKKEDAINTELQDVLNKNKELITGFIGKIKEIQKPNAPEVNVDINQKEVITSVEQMEKNIVEALGSLEKQVKLSMERKPLKVEFVIVDRTSVGFASRIIAKEL